MIEKIKIIISSIKRDGSFLQNALMMFSSRFIGFILTLFFTPILSRLYAPESYGLLSVFMIVSNLFVAIGSLGFPEAMAVAKTKESLYKLFWVALGSYLVISIPWILSLPWFAEMFGYENNFDRSFLILIWLGILTIAFFNLLNKWIIFHNEFKFYAKINVFGSIINRTFSIAISYLSISQFGLILGEFFGHFSQNTALSIRFLNKELLHSSKSLSVQKLKEIFTEYKSFIYYYPALNLLHRLSPYLVLLVVLKLYGLEELGQYSMAIGLITIPINLLANSLYSVFLQKFNSLGEADVTRFLEKITKTVLGLLAVPVIGMILILPKFLPFFLGSQWHLSGEIAAILSIFVLHEILGVCYNSLLHAKKKQRMLFHFNVLRLVIVASGLFIGYQFEGIFLLISYYALAVLLFNTFKIHYILTHFNASGRLINFIVFVLFAVLLTLTRF